MPPRRACARVLADAERESRSTIDLDATPTATARPRHSTGPWSRSTIEHPGRWIHPQSRSTIDLDATPTKVRSFGRFRLTQSRSTIDLDANPTQWAHHQRVEIDDRPRCHSDEELLVDRHLRRVVEIDDRPRCHPDFGGALLLPAPFDVPIWVYENAVGIQSRSTIDLDATPTEHQTGALGCEVESRSTIDLDATPICLCARA